MRRGAELGADGEGVGGGVEEGEEFGADEAVEEEGACGEGGLEAGGGLAPDGVGRGWWRRGGEEVVIDLEAEFGREGEEGGHGLGEGDGGRVGGGCSCGEFGGRKV